MIKKVWETNNLISYMLLPFSLIYLVIIKIYKFLKDQKTFTVPVICVGNITTGGAGKTPTVIEIRRLLSKHINKIFVLTRGYKGKATGPLIVKKNSKVIDVGDESLLLSKQGPTCVSKKKIDGAKLCENLKSNLIIMDDGLQSIDIRKNFRILVIDGDYGFGNKKIFPSGPLREPIEDCINNSDIILIIDPKKKLKELNNIPKERLFFAKKIINFKSLLNKKLFVFSAIGNNKNFHKSLINSGLKIKKIKNFPDHYYFKKHDLRNIIEEAKKDNLFVVCTEKDYTKIPTEYKKFIFPIKLKLKINESGRLIRRIINVIMN